MLRRWMPLCCFVGLVTALSHPAPADGIPGARDREMTFHVVKGGRTFVNLDSKTPAETIKGVARDMSGNLKLNPAKLDKAEGKFTVPCKKLDMSNSKRGTPLRPNKPMQQHMSGSDWLDTEKYPDAVFTVTAIEDIDAKKKAVSVTLKGKLSVHGVEKDVSIPAKLTYTQGKEADGSKDTLAILADFDIKLADHDIKGRPGSIGTGVADTMKMHVSAMMSAGDGKKPKSADAEKKAPAKPKPPARIQ